MVVLHLLYAVCQKAVSGACIVVHGKIGDRSAAVCCQISVRRTERMGRIISRILSFTHSNRHICVCRIYLSYITFASGYLLPNWQTETIEAIGIRHAIEGVPEFVAHLLLGRK